MKLNVLDKANNDMMTGKHKKITRQTKSLPVTFQWFFITVCASIHLCLRWTEAFPKQTASFPMKSS